MNSANWTRRTSLVLAGLAVAGMGMTVGCSSKQSPAPTAPVQESVDSKRPQGEMNQDQPKPQKPPVKAKPAPTAEPGQN